MNRPNEQEFMAEVLRELPDVPEGLTKKLAELVENKDQDRAQLIKALFEEASRE